MFAEQFSGLPGRNRRRAGRIFLGCLSLGLLLAFAASSYGEGPLLMPPHPRLLGSGVKAMSKAMAAARAAGVDRPRPVTAPVTGARGALVLMVDFSDKVANPVSTRAVFEDLLFSTGNTPPRSMSEYYDEVSYGQLALYGQVNGSVAAPDWYRAPHTYAYYVNGAYGTSYTEPNSKTLVKELIPLVDAYVDFSEFDRDGDGYVDGLFILHAGIGAEYSGNSSDIWSHKWSLDTPVTVDGVIVQEYSVEPEFVASAGDSTIGVFCHEFGHVLGLPDLYDTDYTSEGLGEWCLMAYGSWNGPNPGGARPPHPNAWCKAYLGWVTPTTITSDTTGVSIPEAENSPTVYKLINSHLPSTQYFLVENRQQTGFDDYLPGAGLCIYHVDTTQLDSGDDNEHEWYPGHTSTGNYLVALEQADGLWELEKRLDTGDTADPWPGSTTKRAFTTTTVPNTKTYGGVTTNVAVQNISDSAVTMTADLLIGVTPSIDYVVSALSRADSGRRRSGDTIQVTWTTKNQGTEAGGGTSTTSIWLSSDTTLDAGDTQLTVPAPDDEVPDLGAGEEDTKTAVTLTLPSDIAPGLYYLIAQADDGGVIAEGNETNNTRSDGAVTVTDYPDYVISVFNRYESNPKSPGDTVEITWVTKNQSNGDATEATTTSIYASLDETLDGSDFNLTDDDVVALTAGAVVTRTNQALTVPPLAPVGTYYLLAIADAADDVLESDETNNVRVGPTVTVIENDPPDTPTNQSPAEGATGVALTAVLTGSDFSDPNAGDTHTSSQWQISDTEGDFGASHLIWDSNEDLTFLTSVTVPSGYLVPDTDYWWRVRYRDSNGAWSDYSTATGFVSQTHAMTVEGTATPTTVDSGGSTSLSATIWDELDHLAGSWSWSDNGAGGSFTPNDTERTPNWTAPGNITDAAVQHRLTVTATCLGSPAASASYDMYITEEFHPALTVLASADPETVANGGTVQLNASLVDPLGHDVTSWSWSDNGAGGVFSPGADAQNPTWTAPGNDTDYPVERQLTVTATCEQGKAGSADVTVVENPQHAVTVTAAADPETIASGGETQLSASATDSRDHEITSWSWSDNGAGGVFLPSAEVQNPIWRAHSNSSGVPLPVALTVTASCGGTPVASDSADVAVTVESLPTALLEFPGAGVYLFSLPVTNPTQPGGHVTLRECISDPDLVVTHVDSLSGQLYQLTTWSAAAQAFTYGTLDDLLSPGHAYIIEVSGACSLAPAGADYTLNHDVRLGWNLLGAPAEAMDLSAALGRIKATSGPWTWDSLYAEYFYSDTLEPTQGYWLSASLAGAIGFDVTTGTLTQNGKLPPATGPKIMIFSDVPVGYWAAPGIATMRWLGITGGYSNDAAAYRQAKTSGIPRFSPTTAVTRVQMAMFLTRAFNLPLPAGPVARFSDISTSNWANYYVEAVYQAGVMGAEPAGSTKFNPSLRMTRAQGAVSLARAAGLALPDPAPQVFDDVLASHWAAAEIAALAELGIFDGAPGDPDLFRPNAYITRAELAQYLDNLLRLQF